MSSARILLQLIVFYHDKYELSIIKRLQATK